MGGGVEAGGGGAENFGDPRARVGEAKLLDAAQLDEIDAEVAQLIDEAVAEARAAPAPDPANVAEDVYVTY